jgi:hypothetical protein
MTVPERRVPALPGLPAVGAGDADRPVGRAPVVQMTLVRPVSGRWVRLLPGATILLCAVLVARSELAWFTAAAAALLVTWRPHLPVGAAVTVLVGLWVFGQPDLLAPTPGQTGLLVVSALVLALHLLLRLSSLAARVSWHGVVEGPVLARLARSVLGAQLVAQSLVLAVVWLRSGVGAAVAGQGWLRVAAVVAAVVVALLVVPRRWLVRPREED